VPAHHLEQHRVPLHQPTLAHCNLLRPREQLRHSLPRFFCRRRKYSYRLFSSLQKLRGCHTQPLFLFPHRNFPSKHVARYRAAPPGAADGDCSARRCYANARWGACCSTNNLEMPSSSQRDWNLTPGLFSLTHWLARSGLSLGVRN